MTGAGNNKRVVTTVKLELADRLKANEGLAKYKKLFAARSDEQLEARVLELRNARSIDRSVPDFLDCSI